MAQLLSQQFLAVSKRCQPSHAWELSSLLFRTFGTKNHYYQRTHTQCCLSFSHLKKDQFLNKLSRNIRHLLLNKNCFCFNWLKFSEIPFQFCQSFDSRFSIKIERSLLKTVPSVMFQWYFRGNSTHCNKKLCSAVAQVWHSIREYCISPSHCWCLMRGKMYEGCYPTSIPEESGCLRLVSCCHCSLEASPGQKLKFFNCTVYWCNIIDYDV